MRSASLLPSTPAGLRGSERLTVLFWLGCLGAVWGLGCLSRGVRCVPLSPFRSGLVGRGALVGVGPVPFQTSFLRTPATRGAVSSQVSGRFGNEEASRRQAERSFGRRRLAACKWQRPRPP